MDNNQRSRSPRAKVIQWAAECGFDLVGVAAANPVPDADRYQRWAAEGMAGEMGYMTEPKRAALRVQMPDWVRSAICVGVLYNGPEVYSLQCDTEDAGWI